MINKIEIKNKIRSIEKSYDYNSYNGKYDVLVDLDELIDLIMDITTQSIIEEDKLKEVQDVKEDIH